MDTSTLFGAFNFAFKLFGLGFNSVQTGASTFFNGLGGLFK